MYSKSLLARDNAVGPKGGPTIKIFRRGRDIANHLMQQHTAMRNHRASVQTEKIRDTVNELLMNVQNLERAAVRGYNFLGGWKGLQFSGGVRVNAELHHRAP